MTKNDDGKPIQEDARTPVKLLRDYWPQEDVRAPAGSEIKVTKEVALKLIQEGIAERNDPLPG